MALLFRRCKLTADGLAAANHRLHRLERHRHLGPSAPPPVAATVCRWGSPNEEGGCQRRGGGRQRPRRRAGGGGDVRPAAGPPRSSRGCGRECAGGVRRSRVHEPRPDAALEIERAAARHHLLHLPPPRVAPVWAPQSQRPVCRRATVSAPPASWASDGFRMGGMLSTTVDAAAAPSGLLSPLLLCPRPGCPPRPPAPPSRDHAGCSPTCW